MQRKGREGEKKDLFPFSFSQQQKRDRGYKGKTTEYLETRLFRQVRKQATMR